MILQALYRYYGILAQDPESDIAPPGYSTVDVSFALELSARGNLLNVIPLYELVPRGNKFDEKPKRLIVPEQFKHSNQISAFFLCDNSTYVLGISDREEEYGSKRFDAFRKYNIELLDKAKCDQASAVINFLNEYEPQNAREHPEIDRNWDALLKGGRLVFMFNGDYVHNDRIINRIWEAHIAGRDMVTGQCLITGEIAPIARLHPPLQGVRNANSTGAALVSFNASAYESYNRVDAQGLNSPVSEKAAIAYSKALNYLLSRANPNKKLFLGDTTVVYWAESDKREYANAFTTLINPEYVGELTDKQEGRKDAEVRMKEVADKVRHTQALDVSRLTEGLDKETRFYVLGLAPNAARIAVRFFLTDPFSKFVDRIMSHYDDMKIEKEFDNQPSYIPIGLILKETVSKKSRDQDAAPLLAGSVMRAILSGAPYPSALYYAIINRIRADMDDSKAGIRKVNYMRAAVIKAFLLRKYRHQPNNIFSEVLIMSLNEYSTIPAYLLGRLFAVLEKAQQDAIGDVNASIKDRYFTSACASPASVFPILLRLSQHHISKAKNGKTYDREIQNILNLFDVEMNPIPARLTLDEQGIFVLGYYHQRADFFKPHVPKPSEIQSPESI